MVPTAVSQILEQIVNAVASIAGAYILLQVGKGLAETRGNDSFGPAYAAAGGTVVGDVIVSLVYRFFIDGSGVSLGTQGAFDSLVIALVFGLLLAEVIGSIRGAYRTETAFEAGEELFPAESKSNFNEEDFEDWFDDGE